MRAGKAKPLARAIHECHPVGAGLVPAQLRANKPGLAQMGEAVRCNLMPQKPRRSCSLPSKATRSLTPCSARRSASPWRSTTAWSSTRSKRRTASCSRTPFRIPRRIRGGGKRRPGGAQGADGAADAGACRRRVRDRRPRSDRAPFRRGGAFREICTGPAIARLAALVCAGHGGQFLVSDDTRSLVRNSLPYEASWRDLGLHGLPDSNRPIRIWQLCHPDLPREFPKLDRPQPRRDEPACLQHFVRGAQSGDRTHSRAYPVGQAGYAGWRGWNWQDAAGAGGGLRRTGRIPGRRLADCAGIGSRIPPASPWRRPHSLESGRGVTDRHAKRWPPTWPIKWRC